MTRQDIARAPAPVVASTEPRYVTNFGGSGSWMG
jgi:hypothetical protein